LGGTWYAKSLPGTHRYDVYEVRFCLKGEQKARTFEELLSLERRGLLGEGDEVIPRWVRTKEAVSEEEILRCETRVLLRESRPPSEPPYVCPCCRTNDCDTWGCIKTCFR
jgi:hypothetical protein